MKTEIHRMGPDTHTILTRTKSRMTWERIYLNSGVRVKRVENVRSTELGFNSDLNENSKPTHRCAVLILEKK